MRIARLRQHGVAYDDPSCDDRHRRLSLTLVGYAQSSNVKYSTTTAISRPRVSTTIRPAIRSHPKRSYWGLTDAPAQSTTTAGLSRAGLRFEHCADFASFCTDLESRADLPGAADCESARRAYVRWGPGLGLVRPSTRISSLELVSRRSRHQRPEDDAFTTARPRSMSRQQKWSTRTQRRAKNVWQATSSTRS